MNDFIQVMTTTATEANARQIAHTLVEKQLAGCVQLIGPITSVYRWAEGIETGQEWLCLIKSRRDLYAALERAIQQSHPYDVPEILATPLVAGSPGYLAWLSDSLGS